MNVNYYKGLGGIYFKSVIFNIIKIGNLNQKDRIILDFGCGSKILSNQLKNNKVFNYDKDSKYTEHNDYNNLYFNTVVFNHVLMYMNKDEILSTFKNIKQINKNCEFLIGIGKGSFLNKFAALISFNFTAHKGTLLSYDQQLKILNNEMVFLKMKKNIFFMTDVFYTKFK